MYRLSTILFSIAALFFIGSNAKAQSVGINTVTPDPTAALDIVSNDKGVLVPRVTSNQRIQIGGGSPATGLLVYDTDVNSFFFFDGTAWANLSGSADTDWVETADAVTTTKKVGIGTTTPTEELEIISDDPDNGSAVWLSNSSSSHFLRMFSGRDGFPTPLLYWNHGDEFTLAMTNPDETNYQPFLGLDGKTMNVYNTGRSIHIGEGAGASDDGTNNGNVNIGYLSAINNATGARNVMIGYRAGLNSTTVSNSVFIGSEAGFSESRDQTLIIENTGSSNPLIYGEFDNDFLRINGCAEVTGKLKLGDDAKPDETGMIRWNATREDFEGFNGNDWVSFTGGGIWGQQLNSNVESSSVEGGPVSDPNSFGRSIAIDGGLMVVGNPELPPPTSLDPPGDGYVELYEKLGGVWTLIQTLTSIDPQAGSGFGFSVDIVGTQIFIGAPRQNDNFDINQGKVYVFDLVTTQWGHVATLTASNAAELDLFGYSLRASGNKVIVGAPAHENIGPVFPSGAGQVYLFERSGSVWSETFHVDHVGSIFTGFGFSVGLDGDYAVVGAPFKTVFGNVERGRIYAYNKTGAVWSEVDNMWASDGAAEDRFGYRVDMSGSDIYAAAPFDDILGGENNQGTIYHFSYDGTDYDETGSFTTPEPQENAELGFRFRIKDGILAAMVRRSLTNEILIYEMNGSSFVWKSSVINCDGSFFGSLDIGTNEVVGCAKDPNKIYFYTK